LLADAGSERNVGRFGISFDKVERIDSDWKFTHRLFVPFLIGSGTVVVMS